MINFEDFKLNEDNEIQSEETLLKIVDQMWLMNIIDAVESMKLQNKIKKHFKNK